VPDPADDKNRARMRQKAAELRRRAADLAGSIASTEEHVAATLEKVADHRPPDDAERLRARADEARGSHCRFDAGDVSGPPVAESGRHARLQPRAKGFAADARLLVVMRSANLGRRGRVRPGGGARIGGGLRRMPAEMSHGR
jgi:hypothetical protein